MKHLALAGLLGSLALAAGCTHTGTAPVRDARPGAAVNAPAVNANAPAALAHAGEHVVRQGETLYAISRRYGVPVQELIAWNNLSRPEQLEVGQTLRVSPGGSARPDAETIPVTPSPGVTVGTIPAAPSAVELPVVKREPLGGKEAYSDEAWARLRAPGQDAAAEGTPPPATDAASAAGAAAPTAPAAPPVASTPADTGWIWPVKGEIVATFSDAGGDSKLRNRGIDIAGKPGTPILAAASGEVAYAGSAVRGLGMMIIIKHDDNYLTAYAHNRAILVKEKDKVAKGQKIAELGSTDTDRPKLHFELRKQGQPVDPLKYLPPM
ncbi:MAG: peptidoglycan DD-metalloendopeptidase family protein [Azoarcus sp.]|nr:peptidoglycan DD-metalloendopeptidase family protein [Azoarcus sp.]